MQSSIINRSKHMSGHQELRQLLRTEILLKLKISACKRKLARLQNQLRAHRKIMKGY